MTEKERQTTDRFAVECLQDGSKALVKEVTTFLIHRTDMAPVRTVDLKAPVQIDFYLEGSDFDLIQDQHDHDLFRDAITNKQFRRVRTPPQIP